MKFLAIQNSTFTVGKDNKMKSIFLFYHYLNFQVVERINSGYRLPPPMVSCSSLKIFVACIKFCFESSIGASLFILFIYLFIYFILFTFIYFYLARQELQGKNHIEQQFRKNPNLELSVNFRLETP